MADTFDFSSIRATAIALVNRFGGNSTPCAIIRNVNVTPADASKPWRGAAATIKRFQFIGVVSVIGFSKRGESSYDGDINVIAPGDLIAKAADGDPGTLCGPPVARVDRLEYNGSEYEIIGVQPIQPDDLPIIYNLRCRAWPPHLNQPSIPF